jgi:hypothetical protein
VDPAALLCSRARIPAVAQLTLVCLSGSQLGETPHILPANTNDRAEATGRTSGWLPSRQRLAFRHLMDEHEVIPVA